MIEQAKKYLNFGWNVIPLAYKTKKPVLGFDKVGHHDKKLTDDELQNWFKETNMNIGVILGKVSDCVCLDIDGKQAYEYVMQQGIPPTITSLSGKGVRYFFKYNNHPTRLGLFPKIDFLSDMFFTVLPPSVHPLGRQYTWVSGKQPGEIQLADVPAWLTEELEKTKDLRKETPQIEIIDEGGRNTHLARLCGKWVKRGLSLEEIYLLMRGVNNEYCHPPLDDKEVQSIINSIVKTHDRNHPDKVIYPVDYTRTFLQVLEEKKNIRRLSTGYSKLDSLWGGFERGRLITVAARTGIGKSAILLNLTHSLIKEGFKTLYLSMEMSVQEQWERLFSMLCQIEHDKFFFGKLTEDELVAVKLQADNLSKNNLFAVYDGMSPNVFLIKEYIEKHKPDVVMLDYLQLCGVAQGEQENRQLSFITQKLKEFSRDFACCIVIASQMNREIEKRDDKLPNLSDLKGSGGIEENSDIVSFLYNDPDAIDGSAYKAMILKTLKNRVTGKMGNIHFNFFGNLLTFKEVE